MFVLFALSWKPFANWAHKIWFTIVIVLSEKKFFSTLHCDSCSILITEVKLSPKEHNCRSLSSLFHSHALSAVLRCNTLSSVREASKLSSFLDVSYTPFLVPVFLFATVRAHFEWSTGWSASDKNNALSHYCYSDHCSRISLMLDCRLTTGLLWLSIIPGVPFLVYLLRGTQNAQPRIFSMLIIPLRCALHLWGCCICSDSGALPCGSKGALIVSRSFPFTNVVIPGSETHRNRPSRAARRVHHRLWYGRVVTPIFSKRHLKGWEYDWKNAQKTNCLVNFQYQLWPIMSIQINEKNILKREFYWTSNCTFPFRFR